ncbi:DNA modification methylase [Patescibacteria group bacterium]|nr:DNA modification methylase [Patescibacteria group bacterium]
MSTKPIDVIDIPLNRIRVDARARNSYGDLKELSSSIKDKGLINPISVMMLPEDGYFQLLAGGRRLAALTQLQMKEVKCVVYPPGLSGVDLYEIELFENIHRKDLEWSDRAALELKIHNLKQAQLGIKISRDDAPGHTMKDTADLLGKSVSSVSKDIQMARLVEQFPELKECKSPADARRRIGKLTNKIILDMSIEQIDKTPVGDIHRILLDSYKVGDFFDLVKSVPDNSCCIAEIDPPYGIDLIKNRKSFSPKELQVDMEDYYEISSDYVEFLSNVLKETYRCLAQDSWLILWFDMKKTETIMSRVLEAGFQCRAIPGIWEKNVGQTNRPQTYLANFYETFLYARKGNPRIQKQGRSNVFYSKRIDPDKKIHPTEKPISLVHEILSTFVEPWMYVMENSKSYAENLDVDKTKPHTVLVPFAGSGSTLLAAANMNLRTIGFDLSQNYYNNYAERVLLGKPPFYGSRE